MLGYSLFETNFSRCSSARLNGRLEHFSRGPRLCTGKLGQTPGNLRKGWKHHGNGQETAGAACMDASEAA
ncbi:hypothetical protein GDO81_006835 [Engystomops pustulosus]|uniref:Uncharacterized protein n=1 Tax=Engystomops pustulosus TaxID=76066 RepID=A0AAV7D311_ENGPU|nr:hypothetical protein GDO81_006835 [Engystomops pustulosus]